jgi:hypothetical protein
LSGDDPARFAAATYRAICHVCTFVRLAAARTGISAAQHTHTLELREFPQLNGTFDPLRSCARS